jgi:hypothetical protein
VIATAASLGPLQRQLDAALLSAARRRGFLGAAEGSGAADRPDPVEWAERISGTALDPWQRRVLRSGDAALLLLCPRQTGKSHVVSLLVAYLARYLDIRVGCLSPTLRQSGIIYRRAREWLRRDGSIKFIRQTAIELELPGGGCIVCFPGDRPDLSVRGDTLDVLVVDEASRVKDSLIAAATPTTATREDARIIYLSTPAGQRGDFFKAWRQQDWWAKVKVDVAECSRIKPAFLARERIRLGPLYRQEFECEFLTAPGGLFDPDRLDEIFRDPGELVDLSGWLPPAAMQAAQAW